MRCPWGICWLHTAAYAVVSLSQSAGSSSELPVLDMAVLVQRCFALAQPAPLEHERHALYPPAGALARLTPHESSQQACQPCAGRSTSP